MPQVRNRFAQRFERECAVVARAPGRVNLIGEHTDYNDGFVLPMALEHSTWVAAAARDDGHVRAVAAAFEDEQSWPLGDWDASRFADWTSYVAGVAELLAQRGLPLRGADLHIESDVPVGSGLSSSAALEVSTVTALATLCNAVLEPTQVADVAREAEHAYARVPCGIMDQYISVLGRDGHALLLDCRSRAWDHIPLSLDGHTFVIVNSGVRHKLAAGEYAVRQEQCRAAVALFRQHDPSVRALRDVSPAALAALARDLEPQVAARARHVIHENARTLAAGEALRRGDLAEFGRLMAASHASLRDDFEVSCRELDLLVETVRAVPGVLGARMTGGGFGGCIVSLVESAALPRIESAVREHYDDAGFGPAQLMQSRPGPGASVEYP